MKRASITVPDDLERALKDYQSVLEVSPAISAIMQAALREYLEERGYLYRGVEEIPDKPRGFHDSSDLLSEGRIMLAGRP